MRSWSALQVSLLVSVLALLAGCARAAQPTPTAAPPTPKAAPAPTDAPAKPAATSALPRAEPTVARPQPTAVAKLAFDERAVAEFYRGKTLRFVVPFAAGGGHDTYTRAIAKHFGRNLPGEPTTVVENLPGAGGLTGVNQGYNAMPRDGTVVLFVSASAVLKQLAADPAVQYDATRLQYLGVPNADSNVLLISKSTGISRLEQLLEPDRKEVVLGGIGPGSPQDVATVILRDVLGARVKLVSGYDGTAKLRLAQESGELDGHWQFWDSIRATFLEKVTGGEWPAIAQLAEPPIAELRGVPSLLDLARTEEQRQIIRQATLAPYQFARIYAVAPGVPAERVAALQAAFERTLADQDFLAEAERAKLAIAPVKADQVRQRVVEFLTMPDTLRRQVVKLVSP